MPDLAPLLTLYYREGCHLCEDMEGLLYELLPTGSFSLKRIDLDDDPELQRDLNDQVPLLVSGKQVISTHFLDLEAVTSLLASYNTPN